MRMNIHGHGMTWSHMSMVHLSCYVSHAILIEYMSTSHAHASIMSMLHTSMVIFMCLFSCIPPKLNMLHPNVRKVCSSSCTDMLVHDHVHVHVCVCFRASRLNSEQKNAFSEHVRRVSMWLCFLPLDHANNPQVCMDQVSEATPRL